MPSVWFVISHQSQLKPFTKVLSPHSAHTLWWSVLSHLEIRNWAHTYLPTKSEETRLIQLRIRSLLV